MNQDQRRLAALMLTDILGYSALTQQDEALALQLLETHRALCRERFAAHGGREVKTMGDAFLVEFDSASAALQCAIDIQCALKRRNDAVPPAERVQLRIGLHMGEVTLRGGDLFGDAVNVVSRLEPLAEPGGICLSGTLYEQVRQSGHPIAFQGKRTLKNLRAPVELYKVLLRGAGQIANPFAVPKEIKSMAVLPFVNLSGDEENEYFSDGLTEDIIAQLARIADLKVISRTSAMLYKGTPKNLRQIGEELGVTTILEGSVRRAGNRVRITANLINAQSDERLWSETFDRELTDIFDIQSEVAQQIGTALRAQISSHERERIARTPTENVEAYHFYLKGRFHWARRTEEDLLAAIRHFERAIALDANYAEAYAGLSLVHNTLADWAYLSPPAAYALAKREAQRALELNPLSSRALTSLAHVRCWYEWQWDEAERGFLRASDLNPGYATVNHWHAECLAARGRLDAALEEIRRAHELDPFSLQINTTLGFILYLARRFEQADEQYRSALEIDPAYFGAHLFRAIALLRDGRFDEAIRHCGEARRQGGNSSLVAGWLGHAHARAGQPAEARALLGTLQAEAGTRYVSPFARGLIHWGLGEVDAAFEQFERALEDRSLWLVYLLSVDPQFDALRADARCQKLLRQMGLRVL